MAINPVLLSGQDDKLPEIYSDYNKIKSAVTGNNSSNVAFEGLPVYGRINSLPDKLEHKDYTPAMGLVTLAVLNGPNDIDDVMSAAKQIFDRKHYVKPYDNSVAQHPFSFFRGTILNKYMNPLSKDCPSPKIAKWLIKQDETLWDTFKPFIQKVFKIDEKEQVSTNIESITHLPQEPSYVRAKQFDSATKFGDITARALTRTSKIGALVLGGLEAAHVIKEVKEGKNFFEEAGKSALGLTTSLAAIGYLGALGAKKFGAAGSLAGMSAGAVVGAGVTHLLS